MTRQEAIEMIESGKVSAKGFIRDRKINRVDVTEEIWAFQNDGKYFLLITKYDKAFYFKDHKCIECIDHVRAVMPPVKEFNNKDQANAYFKKAAEGFKRYNG